MACEKVCVGSGHVSDFTSDVLHEALMVPAPLYIHTICSTVEPPYNGQVGALTLVHYSEIVLYWGVLVKKKPYICTVGHIEIFYSRLIIVIRDKRNNTCSTIATAQYLNGYK